MKRVSAELKQKIDFSEDEKQELWEWSEAYRAKNTFDPQTLLYPHTAVLKASDSGRAMAYVPIHPVMMFESYAPKPDATVQERALSLWHVWQLGEQVAKEIGCGEMFFMTSDEGHMRAASRRGWTVSLFDREKNTWLMKRKVFPLPAS